MKKIKIKILLIFLLFVFGTLESNAQHYFTIQELVDLCSSGKIATEKAASKYNMIRKGDLFSTKDLKLSIMYSDYSNSVAFVISNPSLNVVNNYNSELSKNFREVSKNGYNTTDNVYCSRDLKYAISIPKQKVDSYIIKVFYQYDGLKEFFKFEDINEYPTDKNNTKIYPVKKGINRLEINSYTNATDIQFKKGDKINIKASGYISLGVFAGTTGPNGIDGYSEYSILKELKHGCLMASTGNNEWFAVGESSSFTADKDGYLSFMVNDGDPSNNSGSFIVEYGINKPLNSAPTKPAVTAPIRTQTYNTQPEPAKTTEPSFTDEQLQNAIKKYEFKDVNNPDLIKIDNEIKYHEDNSLLYYKLSHPLYKKSIEYRVGSKKYEKEIEQEKTDKLKYENKLNEERKVISELYNERLKIINNKNSTTPKNANINEKKLANSANNSITSPNIKSILIKSYKGTITNTTFNLKGKCEMSFSKNSDGTFQLKGELDKIKLVGKWDLTGKLIENNVYNFKGDIILGYEGTDFPLGTSAPIMITVSIDEKSMIGNYSIQGNEKNIDSQVGVFKLY